MPAHIFDRPDIHQTELALLITGTLPNGKPGLAYEGRLQIHNAIGACTVEQIDGDTLPPGHALYVDQQAGEVVIAWPEYAEVAAPITNPQFDDGMAGWAAGAGWSVTTNNPITGSHSAVYARNPGSSILSSQSRYPVVHGTPIHAECDVRQGASSAGNAGAGVRLEFRNNIGAVIAARDGNMVMSASKNRVYPSRLDAMPPPDAATVNIACHGLRKRENKDVWVDSFRWDHKVAHAGINIETTLNLTLRVRDSAGRTALWSGSIDVVLVVLDKLLAIGRSAHVSDSEDGIAWTAAVATSGYYAVGSKLVAVSGGRVLSAQGSSACYSDNRRDFTIVPTGLPRGFTGGDSIVAVGDIVLCSIQTSGIGRSADRGETWAEVAAGKNSERLGHKAGLVVSISNTSQPMSSVDAGVSWSPLGPRLDGAPTTFNPGSQGASDGDSIAFGGETWGGPHGVSAFIPAIIETTDGVNFQVRVVEVVSAVTSGNVSFIIFGGGRWVAITSKGWIYTSEFLAGPWLRSSTVIELPRSGAFNNARFVIGSNAISGSKIIYGENGLDWTESVNPLPGGVASIVRIIP